MAKQNNENDNPIIVIGSGFVRPQSLELIITGDTVTDTDGNKMFHVKTPLFGLHTKRILVDPHDSPVVTMKMKATSRHDRWEVYRSKDSSDDLMFTVKRSSSVQLKTRVDVFMKPNPTEEDPSDFTVKGRFMKRKCLVYVGESDKIIAQVHEGDHKLLVTVYPNVDHAFIVTLVLIFDLVNMGTVSHS